MENAQAWATATPAFMVTPHALLEADPYLEPGHPASEIALRNQLLAVFRQLRLKPHNRLIGQTLSRYWQERGLCAADLRVALEVALRDGHLAECHDDGSGERYWALTEEGEAYGCAKPTPRALAVLAPHVGVVHQAPSPAKLRRMALRLFHGDFETDFYAMRQTWRATGLDVNALLHALDLLYKRGLIELTDDDPLSFRRTRPTPANDA